MIFDASTGGNAIAWGNLSTAKTVNNGNTPKVESGEVVIEMTNTETSKNMSDYLANKILDAVFNGTSYTAPSTYVALWTADLTFASNGSTSGEVSGNGYARKQVNNDGSTAPYWTTATAGTLENHDDINFPTPTGSWGTVTAMMIADASTAGNMLFFDNNISDTPQSGDEVKYAAGDLDISLD